MRDTVAPQAVWIYGGFCLAMAVIASDSQAATKTWVGGQSGNNAWGQAANWSPSGFAAGDDVVFDNNSANHFTNNLGANRTVGSLTVNDPIYTIQITNNTLTITNGLYVNGANLNIQSHITIGASQAWNIASGRTLRLDYDTDGNNRTLRVNENLTWSGTIEYDRLIDINSNATLTIGADASLHYVAGPGPDAVLRIAGTAGAGSPTINQSGGTVTLGRSTANSAVLNIGQANLSGGTATYHLSGGLLDADDLTRYQINVGNSAGAPGVINVSGTGELRAAQLRVGNSAEGTFTLAGGQAIVSTSLDVPVGGSSGTVNLDGGSLQVAVVNKTGAGDGFFNFNGGTLVALAANSAFMSATLTANVRAGGARIDTAGFDVTILAPLLDGGGGGGLTKLGAGTLTLAGANTYTGPTSLQQGGLGLGTAYGGGAISAADGTSLRISVSSVGSTLTTPVLTLGGTGTTAVDLVFDLGSFGNPTSPVINAGGLAVNAGTTVRITGNGLSVGRFTLIKYSGEMTGTGFLDLTALPTGVVATLIEDPIGGTVDLDITSAPSLVWDGASSDAWDIGLTPNWIDPVTSLTTTFSDGTAVRLDDSASGSTTIALATAVSPGGVLVSNTLKTYSLDGPGRISGGGRLVKDGPGTLFIAALNDYSGNTRVNAGTLALGASEVIPHGLGKGEVLVDGTLDLAGFNETITGLSGSGVIDNSSTGTSPLLTVGNNNASSVFTGAIQNTGGGLTLDKRGGGTLTLTGNSSYSGGTTNSDTGTLQVGHDNALGTGPVWLRVNTTFSSADATPHTLANDFILGGNCILGDAVNNGTLTLNGAVGFNGGARNLTFNSDVIMATSSSNGRMANKAGPGTLTLRGTHTWSGGTAVIQNGSFVIEGVLTNDDGVRPDCNVPGGTSSMVIATGGSLALTGANRNQRVGNSANVGATNILDIAGSLRMPDSVVDHGRLLIGAGCALAVANLLPGGDAELHFVDDDGAAGNISELNFNGGILRPIRDSADFIRRLDFAYVRDGGAIIDSGAFNITIAQPLLAGGTGGLTKRGSGSLTLTGTNTYTGLTAVEEGNLIITPAHQGGGAFSVADGAKLTLSLPAPGAALVASALTLNSNSRLTFDLGSLGTLTTAPIVAGNLSASGTALIDISAVDFSIGQFPLIGYSGAIGGGGIGALALGQMPRGVTATLTNNTANSTVDLLITAIDPLIWRGYLGNAWDIAGTANWDLNSAQTSYLQSGIPGEFVLFNDTGLENNIDITTLVSPASVTVSNESVSYSFIGNGGIGGPGGLTKQGAGTLTVATSNDYSGTTLVAAGVLALGSSEAIPHGAGKGDVIVDGTLDVAGWNESINGLSGSGVIDNTAFVNTWLTIGNGDASGAFAGTIQNTGDNLGLIKTGNGAVALSGVNTYIGGTSNLAGALRVGDDNALGTGALTLGGGAISSESSTARTIGNPLVIGADNTLGDPVNNGALVFNGGVDFAGGTVRYLTIESDVTFSGTTANGGIERKFGLGTLTFKNLTGDMSGNLEIRQGTVVVDGGNINRYTNGVRLMCTDTNSVARFVVTNGATYDFTHTGSNLRVGSSSPNGDPTSTNIADIAGIVQFPLGTGSGALQIGANSALAALNLWPGGSLRIRTVTAQQTAGSSELNFHGGTLLPTASSASFMENLTAAYIHEGGAVIDTTGFDITIAQPLLAGAGTGGLTKLGSGTLLLNGANTYGGTTLVNEGTLGGVGVIAGPVVVASGGALAPGVGIGTLTIGNSLTLQGNVVMELNKTGAILTSDLVTGLQSVSYGGTLTLVATGDALAPGDSFTLFEAGDAEYIGQFDNIVPPSLPPGMVWDFSQLGADGTISVQSAPREAPSLSAPAISGSTLTFGGTGGTPGAAYEVVASDNAAAPLSTWTVVDSGTLGVNGEFTASIAIDPANPRRFYVVRLP